jgi:hypothetical protein
MTNINTQAGIALAGLSLQEYANNYCPRLQGSPIIGRDELMAMVVRFDGDVESCKSALDAVNTRYTRMSRGVFG